MENPNGIQDGNRGFRVSGCTWWFMLAPFLSNLKVSNNSEYNNTSDDTNNSHKKIMIIVQIRIVIVMIIAIVIIVILIVVLVILIAQAESEAQDKIMGPVPQCNRQISTLRPFAP